MRVALALTILALAAPAASAQFTPPGQSEDIRYWGIHYETNGALPLDRITSIRYTDTGAAVVHADTPLPALLAGIVSSLASGDGDAPERTEDTFVPLPIDVWIGRTFVPTPVGEVGLGVDYGGAGMTGEPGTSDLDLVLFAGPNVLVTSRPLPNLHLVGHAGYQLMFNLGGGAQNELGNRLLEFDVQATYPLSGGLAVYGGVHLKDWTFPQGEAETAPTATFSTTGFSVGLKLSTDYLFLL